MKSHIPSRYLLFLTLVSIAMFALTLEPVFAQRGGDRGGDRGGRGGDRGGERGGDRGGGRSGDRGGNRGGFRGGPPGQGRGGFDPTFILQRMDRNGNGRLDPDEIDDRAKGMLNRFAPGIDTSKPVKFEDVRQKFREAREARERGGDRGGRRGDRGGDREANEQTPTIEPLVPGFGEEVVLEPVPAFGGSGAFFAVSIVKADEAEADRTLDRYDRNRNGRLEREEIRNARWIYGDPNIYDQNGDGSLSKRELAVRYAKRRLLKEENKVAQRRERGRRDRDREDRDRDRDDEEKDKDQKTSYRFLSAHERLPSGIPDAFRKMDVDLDGQISMSEFASEWDDTVVSKFTSIDSDGNGILTPTEAIDFGEFGGSGGMNDAPERASNEASKQSSSSANKPIPEKYRTYAEDYIKRYDLDGNGSLSKSEVEKMRRPPKDADRNGDGRITPEEYARSIMR